MRSKSEKRGNKLSINGLKKSKARSGTVGVKPERMRVKRKHKKSRTVSVFDRLYKRPREFTPHLTRVLSKKLKDLSQTMCGRVLYTKPFYKLDPHCSRHSSRLGVTNRKARTPPPYSDHPLTFKNKRSSGEQDRTSKLKKEKIKLKKQLMEMDLEYRQKLRMVQKSADLQKKRADNYKLTIKEMAHRIDIINLKKD